MSLTIPSFVSFDSSFAGAMFPFDAETLVEVYKKYL